MGMGGRKKQYLLGTVMLLAAAAFILTVFSRVSRTDLEQAYLSDSQDQRYGWRYEVLLDGQVQDYEPQFDENGYVLLLPEGTEAVRITREMTEEENNPELEWITYLDGVELFLDGDLLYSDFAELTRDDNGFVHPDEAQWERLLRLQGDAWRQTRMSLPADYLGKELTMITYFPADGPIRTPEYPFFGDSDTFVAQMVALSVRNNAMMTVYAILALLMAGTFLLDIRNGSADGRTLLLCVYFLMLFLYEAYNFETGYFSGLSANAALGVLCRSYMTPLYLYLALRLRSQWKWVLSGGVLFWTVYEVVQEMLRLGSVEAGTAETIGPEALVILLVLAAALCAEGLAGCRRSREKRREMLRYGLVAAAVMAVYVFGRVRAWGGMGSYLRDGIWSPLVYGNYGPILEVIANVISYMAVIMVVSQVVRRSIRTSQTVSVLQERSRLTLEGYERMLRAEEATNAANHEMRHHMTALAGILKEGDTERAREYVQSVTRTLDRLPSVRYSANILVNAVAGSYLDQAKARGIRVECSLKVPEELDIPDGDLSVFLTNMLENALHACQLMDPGQERYIRFKMALHENFLFIGCANSAPEEQEEEQISMEERARRRHGYGLEAMRQIAEKYSSMLLLERTAGEYSVRSNFNLKASRSAGPRG